MLLECLALKSECVSCLPKILKWYFGQVCGEYMNVYVSRTLVE